MEKTAAEKAVISVLIPVTAGADALISCVDSFLSQKGTEDLFGIEILLCTPSSASLVDSRELEASVLTCKGLAAYDPRVRVVDTSGAGKPFFTAAFLSGLSAASGDYLLFSDGRSCPADVLCASLLAGAMRSEDLLVFASDPSDPPGKLSCALCPVSGAMRFYNCLFETGKLRARFQKNAGAIGMDVRHHLPLHILLDAALHSGGLFAVGVPDLENNVSPCLPENELSETELCAQITELTNFIGRVKDGGDTEKTLLEKTLTPYTPAVLRLLSEYAAEKKRAEAFMNRSQLQKWLLYAQFPKSCRSYEKNVRTGNYTAFRSAYLSDRRREKSAMDARLRQEKREQVVEWLKRREKTFLLLRKTGEERFSVVPGEMGRRFHSPVLLERAAMTYLIVCERDRYTDTDTLFCVNFTKKTPYFGDRIPLPLPENFTVSQTCLQTLDAWIYLYVFDEKTGEWYRSRMRRCPDLWEAFTQAQKPLLADHKEPTPTIRTDKYLRVRSVEKYVRAKKWEAISVYTRLRRSSRR